jgi:MFS family permease
VRELVRERNFRLLLVGQTLTMFGDVALILVMGIWVKQLTGSTSAAGGVFLVLSLPAVVAPFAGVVIDRFPRRRVMIVNDLVSAAFVLSLLGVHGRGDIWIIYLVAGGYGLVQQVFFAARSGLLVTMLSSDLLGDANGLMESIRQGLRIVGPLVGAGMFAFWGGGSVAVVDSGTFLVSAVMLAMMHVPEPSRGRTHTSLFEEITAGARHLARTPDLRLVVVLTAVVLCFVGLSEVAVFALVDEGLHRPAAFLGVLGTAQGVGAIAGGIYSPRLMRRLGELWLIALGLVTVGVGLGMFGVPTLPTAFAGSVILGVGISAFTVGYATLLQRRTSEELQGRVFTAAEAIYSFPYSGSIALGTFVVTVVDFRLIYGLQAVVLTAAGLFLFRRRHAEPDLRPPPRRAGVGANPVPRSPSDLPGSDL